jgi:hypothetical protein
VQIADFIAFADARSPGFSRRIEPITPELMAEVQAAARHPLPALYLSYLEAMGGSPAEFQRKRWSLDPYDVIDEAAMASRYPHDRFTLMALHAAGPLEPQMNWYFDHAADFDHSAECRIVKFEGGHTDVASLTIRPVFGSFMELLVEWAARIFCFEVLPSNRELQYLKNQTRKGNADDGHARCCAILQRLGFQQRLGASKDLWLGELGETVAMVQHLGDPGAISFFVTLGGTSEHELGRVAEVLGDNLI